MPAITLQPLPARRLAQALWLALGLASCGGGGAQNPAPGGAAPPVGTAPVVGGLALDVVAPQGFPDLKAESGLEPGQVVLRFTAPAGPSGARADGYDVRAQVKLLLPENAAAAPALPVSATPAAPGVAEALTLTGLEGGRPLQFAVRARFGAAWGPFSHGVAARVKDGGPPAPPANAVRISAARTLDQAGATYLLTADVSAPGTAFPVTARNVTLDLGGHTVTYGTAGGTCYGVYTEYQYDSGALVVRNGSIVQGAGLGSKSPAVVVRGGHDVRLSRLDVRVAGPDCHGILVYDGLTGALRIDHCSVACLTTVVTDRHFPGVAALWLGALEGPVEIDSNLVTASPQWGIKVQGRSTTGELLIHHNRILGTKALVSNAYALGIHKPKARVFENEVLGESRGIHLDGQDNFGHEAEVCDNAITAQDQPNAENPVHWTHGIKVEGAGAAKVFRNRVLAVADPQHAEAIALDVGLGARSDVEIRDNLFIATSSAPGMLAHALSWSSGTLVAPNLIRIERNVFRSSDRAITRGWAARVGGTIAGNAFLNDPVPGHAWQFEYMDVSDIWPSPGNRLIDVFTDGAPTTVTQWAQPAAYDVTREATLRVRVLKADGTSAAGAQVSVTDAAGGTVASGVADGNGVYDAVLLLQRITNGPALDVRGPFGVRAVAPEGAGTASGVAPTGRMAVFLRLGSDGHEVDSTAPPAPPAPACQPLSGSRALVWWAPGTDASGVALTEVRLDGEVVALTPGTAAILSGLSPGRTYAVRLRFMDGGGNLSPAGPSTPVTLRSEDRGP